MYNCKVYKYPSGYQYRLYSRPVGAKLESDNYFAPDCLQTVMVDNGDGELESVVCDPSKMWVNIFSGEFEKAPHIIEERDFERSAKNSLSRTVNKIYEIARSNVWEWFFTLTFNPEIVNSYDYSECCKKLSKWISNCRRYAPYMKYLFVPEQHKSGRFHFHGLVANCDGLDFVDSGIRKKGMIIYNVGRYKLGFSTSTRILDNEKATKYICKYISKELCAVTFGKKRYWASRNLDMPIVEEVSLEKHEFDSVLADLIQKGKHVKKVEGPEVSTYYIEMGVDYGNN